MIRGQVSFPKTSKMFQFLDLTAIFSCCRAGEPVLGAKKEREAKEERSCLDPAASIL